MQQHTVIHAHPQEQEHSLSDSSYTVSMAGGTLLKYTVKHAHLQEQENCFSYRFFTVSVTGNTLQR